MSSVAASRIEAPRYKEILLLATPIVLSNATEPLLGLVDTAVIGHHGTESDLGGIALGALIFAFLYWGFGFLRMGTTGFVAQDYGREDDEGIRATVGRALLLALAIGVAIIALQPALQWLAFQLLDGSPSVHQAAKAYFSVRIWSTPASLINFVVFGTIIGLGKSRALFGLQVLLNGLNILLDVVFVTQFDMGVRGIALGTVLAQYACMAAGLWVIYRYVRPTDDRPLWPWERIMQREAWNKTLRTNMDIMWRTLFLLGGFAWFINQSAKYGDDVLAANDILLQLISFSTFFLDGFAFVVEALIGRTLGAGRIDLFRITLRRTSILSGITAFVLGAGLWIFGPTILRMLAPIESVLLVGVAHLPFAALYIILSFGAFLLDGVFVGATRGPEMRNSAILSTLLLIGISLWWMQFWGNAGLWMAFIAFVVIRAITLGLYMPRILRDATG